jgi:putative acetyltransferase
VSVRAADPNDAASIRGVTCAAFGGDQEANLVDELDRAGELLISMVAEEAGQIVGHVGFSRLWIERAGQRLPGASLAPLAVAAGHRRRRIGAALIEAGHQKLRGAGESIIFVLGDRSYYRRFGYSAHGAAAFDCVYAGPHFQALTLTDLAPKAGVITYAAAFGRLG